MDTITHIVLGACIGEVIAGKQLGKKALLYGAIAQSLPDIDFVSSLWDSTSKHLLSHRGFTHSILCTLIITPLLGILFRRWYSKLNISTTKWSLFWGLQIFIHLFIDSFNSYGTGLFEPFSHTRISFNTIFVVDPLFTIVPFIAFIALLILKRKSNKRSLYGWLGIALSSLYLFYCIINKTHIENEALNTFKKQHISYTHYFTTPAPLNNLLWFAAAENDTAYYIGYHSVLDKRNDWDFHCFPKNDSLLNNIRGNEELQHLLRFSKGYYTVEKWHDTLVFNDIRFGQIGGWTNPEAKFAFHFFLEKPGSNKYVVQRGRMEVFNKKALADLFERINGN